MFSVVAACAWKTLHSGLWGSGLLVLCCTSLWFLGVWPTCSFNHFGIWRIWPTCPFIKKKSECHSLTPHPNPPFLEARKGGLASASPASPASVPSLVLRATGTSSCGLGWGGSQLRVRGRCSKLGLDGVRVVYMMRVARLV